MSIIEKRRSTRVFSEREVNESDLMSIATSALYAPSSKNIQPWEIIALNDKVIIHEIAEVCKIKLLSTVSTCVIVCTDLKKEQRETHCLIAGSTASQNILLKATELGIDSVWLDLYKKEDRISFIKSKFGLGDNILPISIIPLGYKKVDFKEKVIDLKKVHVNKYTAK